MRYLFLLVFTILFSSNAWAQIPSNYTATDCNSNSRSIHTQIGTTGKSVIVMSKGVDCSACRFSAPSWQTWASNPQNAAKVEVWAAMTYRYNPMSFSNPCGAINSWVSQYAWNDIYAFHDVNRDFLGPAMPRYYVYSAIDSTLIYNGSSSTTARNMAIQNSVVGIEELQALKAVSFQIINQQLIIEKQNQTAVLFKIIDLSGRMVQSFTVNQAQKTVDFSKYSKGIYVVNMVTEGAAFSRKILVP